MNTSKSQRLVNLVICLLSKRDFQTAEQIRNAVQGYEDSASDAAFERIFERDKKELFDAGIVLEKGIPATEEQAIGYRIRRSTVELPPLEVPPTVAGVLAVVGMVWAGAERTAEVTGALNKLRAAGLRPQPAGPVAAADNSQELSIAAELTELAANQRVVQFSHTSTRTGITATRTIEPWLVATRDGHWYVVGFDQDRQGVRTFRLNRITALSAVARTHPRQQPPSAATAHEILDRAVSAFDAAIDARVWVATKAAAELRSLADASTPATWDGRSGDELRISSASRSRLSRLITGAGANAKALEPTELVDEVLATLRSALEVDS